MVLFAIDSADFHLLENWCAQGALPHISSLRESGAAQTLAGGGIFDEVGSWCTLYCGQPPWEHGYYSGRRLRPGSYELETINHTALGYSPFWNLLNSAGLEAAILEAPEGKPVPGLDGIQLFNLCQHQEEYARGNFEVRPPELAADIGRFMPDFEVLRFDRFKEKPSYYRRQLEKNLHQLRGRNKLFRHWLAGGSHDFVLVGFGEAHDAGHLVWPWHVRAEAEGSQSPLLSIYQAIDAEIGKYRQLFGDDCTYVLVSTYGMKSQYPMSALGEALLTLLGYQVKRPASLNWTSPISVIRYLVPEPIRRALSGYLPLQQQMKLSFSNFADGIDFSRSRAFNLPGLFSNWIRINLAGRDPRGTVSCGAEYERLLDEIAHEFRQLTDPLTGQKAVSTVLKMTDNEGFDPMTSNMPDLYVHWRSSDRFVEQLNHPAGRVSQARPNFLRDTYHALPGFFYVSAPGIQPGDYGQCSYLDVAPSCLDLLGLPASAEMRGESLRPRWFQGATP